MFYVLLWNWDTAKYWGAALHAVATRWRVTPMMVLVLQCTAADYSKGFLGISVTLIKAAGTSSSSFRAATA